MGAHLGKHNFMYFVLCTLIISLMMIL